MQQPNFSFHFPTRVRFGAGVLGQLPDELRGLGARRIFLLTDSGLVKVGLADRIEILIRGVGLEVRVFSDIETNPTAATVARALEAARAFGPEAIVAVGGGSPIDVGKVVAFLLTNPGSLAEYQWEGRKIATAPVPLIAVSTTSGTGSEVTRTAVILDRNTKKGIVSDHLFPRTALVDPELTRSMPPKLTAATGVDALSHALEAYVGKGIHPLTESWALWAVELIMAALPRAYADGDDLAARADMALASSMAGVAMDQSGLGIIHSMASPLSGLFNVHHGLANAVLLAAGMRFNLPVVPERHARLARALGVGLAGLGPAEASEAMAKRLDDFVTGLGIDCNLALLGVKESDLEPMGRETTGIFLLRNNPRPANAEECTAIFRSLWRRVS
ncbi:MAG TPA: iron-containing alcohol dehydrogenase [Bacillota bacterium]|jgi:alcohol dehydrogenase